MKIEFADDFKKVSKRQDCQVFVAIQGDRNFVIEQLTWILNECNDCNGTPRQGIKQHHDGTCQTIRPYWNYKKD